MHSSDAKRTTTLWFVQRTTILLLLFATYWVSTYLLFVFMVVGYSDSALRYYLLYGPITLGIIVIAYSFYLMPVLTAANYLYGAAKCLVGRFQTDYRWLLEVLRRSWLRYTEAYGSRLALRISTGVSLAFWCLIVRLRKLWIPLIFLSPVLFASYINSVRLCTVFVIPMYLFLTLVILLSVCGILFLPSLLLLAYSLSRFCVYCRGIGGNKALANRISILLVASYLILLAILLLITQQVFVVVVSW